MRRRLVVAGVALSLSLGLSVGLSVGVGAGCATTVAGVKAGSVAPDFTLPALVGGDIKLAELRGAKAVVVDFWASWCAPCRLELPELEKLRAEYEPRGVRFVAVNIDHDRATAEEAAGTLHLTMPVALDPEKRVAAAFSPPTMPSSYVLDASGTVRFVHEGYAGPADIDRFRKELDGLTK